MNEVQNLDKIVDLLKLVNVNSDEAKKYIYTLFSQYKRNLKDNYENLNEGNILEIILACFFLYCDMPSMEEIFNTFRSKYIYNENELEYIHSLKERKGLGVAYDFISEFNDYNILNVTTVITIHKKLFSLIDKKDFGGSVRNMTVFIKGSPTDLCPPEYIAQEITKLLVPSQNLAKKAREIVSQNDPIEKIKFINECVDFNCKLIKIHPFLDGNGRAIRILTNLYFKMAGIPPVYVEKNEREAYMKAINDALKPEEAHPDPTKIRNFYYYKICDSMVKLDLLKVNKEKLTSGQR